MMRLLVLLMLVLAGPSFAAPASPATWRTYDLAGDKGPESNRFKGGEEEFLGRKAMRVQHGLAVLEGSEMRDGMIEADIAPSEQGFLLGLAFRVQTAREFELAFFRAPLSGTPEALQYTPFFNGANGWQLHPDEQAAVELPQGRWTHVRIVLAGATATVFVGDSNKPALTLKDLGHGDSRGAVAFYGAFGGGYVSNLRVTPGPDTRRPAEPPAKPKGSLTDWGLSPAFDVAARSGSSYAQRSTWKWQPVKAEASGLITINRYRDSPEIMPTPSRDAMEGDFPGARVVFARTIVNARTAALRKLRIGYSDDVTVYLNGRPLYAGKNAWRFREPDARGTPTLNDTVYLPLLKGDNEVVMAVTEYMGGWGFRAVLSDPANDVRRQ